MFVGSITNSFSYGANFECFPQANAIRVAPWSADVQFVAETSQDLYVSASCGRLNSGCAPSMDSAQDH